MRKLTILLGLVCVMTAGGQCGFGFEFTAGHFYASEELSPIITEYDSDGTVLDNLTVPLGQNRELQGLGFGPDALLYGTVCYGGALEVVAMNSSGSIVQQYSYPAFSIWNNTSYGKLVFDNAGRFYVGGADGIARFDIGNAASGTKVSTLTDIFDVDVLPNGNILATDSYDIFELAPNGDILGTLTKPAQWVTDIRGIAHDPTDADILYASALGFGLNTNKIVKLDMATGLLLEQNDFHGEDICIAEDGRVIFGSRTGAPGIFSDELGPLGGANKPFVTQFIPEPTTVSLMSLGLLAMGRRRKK